MRFRQQLTSIDDQRLVIPRRQDTLRSLIQRTRHLERELYRLERLRDYDDEDDDGTLLAKLDELQCSLDDTKEQVLSSSLSYRVTTCLAVQGHPRSLILAPIEGRMRLPIRRY